MTATEADVVDLFAAGGGWDEGLRRVGVTDVIGLEWDGDACATAVAAGHSRLQVDVAKVDTRQFVARMRRLIGSPPCTKFTSAGNGMGRLFLALLADGIRDMFRGEDRRQEIREAIYPACLADQQARNAKRPESKRRSSEQLERAAQDEAYAIVLVLEPARFIVDALASDGPLDTVLLEQVTEVLPLWQIYKLCLVKRGFSVWTGVLNSADYGVPQTRERAILIARLGAAAVPPEPTHARNPEVDLFGAQRLPWVSMAGALGWSADVDVVSNYSDGTTGGRGIRRGSEPSSTVTSKSRNVRVEPRLALHTNRDQRPDGSRQVVDAGVRPAPTLTGKSGGQWVLRSGQSIAGGDHAVRAMTGPAVTITGRADLCSFTDGVQDSRLTLSQASILQSFPADYPWQGNQSSQFLQVGNAVPPVLAAAVAAAAGIAQREAMSA